ncbi:MAG: hypothetical protein R3B96_17660 [Pirellulaceae bacterium]
MPESTTLRNHAGSEEVPESPGGVISPDAWSPLFELVVRGPSRLGFGPQPERRITSANVISHAPSAHRFWLFSVFKPAVTDRDSTESRRPNEGGG